MKLSIQRFFVFMVISFSFSPVAILSAEYELLPEHILTNDTLFAFRCFAQAKNDQQLFAKKGMSDKTMWLSFNEDVRLLREDEARQAVQRSFLDEEMTAVEQRQKQEKEAKKEAVLRQRAALLATVDREMSAGWSSKPGNTSWR